MANVRDKTFFNSPSLFGYFNKDKNARFYVGIGGRQTGKTYFWSEEFVKDFIKNGVPFYWIRLKESSMKKLLSNNGEKLLDPPIKRKYKLILKTKGNQIYNIRVDKDGNEISRKLMCTCYALSTYYNDKGIQTFDFEFLNNPKMRYNIIIDEFSPEQGERTNTSDLCYSLVNQLENILRNTKERIRCALLCNLVGEANEILAGCFNFIPREFGRYWLGTKKCLVDYLEPTQAYLSMREESVANLLMPNAGTFTNTEIIDDSLVNRKRLIKPHTLIMFDKDPSKWFVVWDNNVIALYYKENLKNKIAMRPYLDERFNNKTRDDIIKIFDARGFRYKNLITFKMFQSCIRYIKPRQS